MTWVLVHVFLVVVLAVRILSRRHRQPESRVAWLLVVFAVPYVGAIAYLMLGETSIGRKRIARLKRIFAKLPRPETAAGWRATDPAQQDTGDYTHLYKIGESMSGYTAVAGNRARLMADSDATITEMIADIDAATDHVHLIFYIWLNDTNGTKMVKALIRAAKRGVVCRAMVDDIGSRDMVKSQDWKDMAAAGVHTASALQVGNPLVRVFNGRIDLRNHRKILVIDNAVTYCGSQNCADPAFLPKAKFAPWVDAVMRFEGPIVRQNQHLFATDWMENMNEDLSDYVTASIGDITDGFLAQVVGTGPTVRNAAMAEMFVSLMATARQELFVTTPYYVPNAPIQAALCSAAYRGVDTTIIFPARNDDFAVGATSKSYYEELLTAGVKVFEYQPGILHTKSLTFDGTITLIGSANMDRRSLDLNYENNILLQDPALTRAMRARQQDYLKDSVQITLEQVQAWSLKTRIWNNALAIGGPVL